MLLNEITTSDEVKIEKINKALKETYGFTLVSEVKSGKLNQLYTKIADDLYDLKLNLNTAQDPAYMQALLVQEGLKMLITKSNQRLNEAAMLAGRGGRKLELVVNKLADYVFKACDVGDSFETAVADAMRAYELWPYRFDKELVEYELRKITEHECEDTDRFAIESVLEGDDCDACDKCECDPCECDKVEEGKLPDALKQYQFGKKDDDKADDDKADDKDDDKDDDKADDKDDDKKEVVEEEQIDEIQDRHASREWVRDISNQKKAKADPSFDYEAAVPEDEPEDFFSYQAKKGKKNEMKEGYVKELRKLLEAEVEQAESLIAAKSFSQELQDMVEKLGRLVNEDLPAVSTQMREAYGSDVASGFEDTVSTTLNGIMDSLRTSKQELDNAVSTIADGGMPSSVNDMGDFGDEGEFGAEDDLDIDIDSDVELDLGDAELGDEFGGADELAGMEDEPLGRAKKESIRIIGKKIVEAEQKIARIKAKQ